MIKLFCAIGALALLAHDPAFAADTASQPLAKRRSGVDLSKEYV